MPQLYDGPIIDAHHHLWDLDLGRHPWLAPQSGDRGTLGDLSRIRRNYLPADYRRDAAGQNIVGSVHVEAGWDSLDPVAETAWLDALGPGGGIAERLVAQVPLAAADAGRLIAAQAEYGRVAGIRDILSWDADPARRFASGGDLMRDPAWRRGFSALGRHGFSFDMLIFPAQLQDALQLAADFPDQQIILNHCGSPIDRDPEGMARWVAGLKALARADNVAIKISDLVAYDNDWTFESLREVTMRCIESFGPHRSMFGSDFPVAGLHASFDQIFDAFKRIVVDFSPDEQRAMFFGNAARYYHFDLR
jgi:predicted TIM-barrel fold metal-dependent hydrolase